MSLLQFPRHHAVFVDRNGDYIGKKRIGWSFGELGIKDKTFEYNNGMYNIVPEKSSRLHMCFSSRLIFDDYIFVYQIDNPDPISFKGGDFKPIMNPEIYKVRLKSKLVKDLNEVAKGQMEIPWKWILIIGVGLLLAYFFLSGGDISSLGGVAS